VTVLNVVFSIFLLIVITWICIFGGVGGLLARARGGSVAAGIAWGVILGPFGWLGIVWTTRASAGEARRAVAAAAPDTDWLASPGASWDD
jgi:hypothetical protein